MTTCASYPLALLNLMSEQDDAKRNPPLGLARRIGVENSIFNLPAHGLLQALLEHSPSPVTIAKEFLVELSKCGIPNVRTLAQDAGSDACAITPVNWARIVHGELKRQAGELKYLTQLGSHYLSHLVIAFRNPGGKKTPQDTVHPTPNLRRIDEIEDLLNQATTLCSQSALKDLIFLRDGYRCLLTGFPFIPPNHIIPRCAHIIPFSMCAKTQSHVAIEAFTGAVLNAEFIQHFINHPSNALNMQTDTHNSVVKYMAWGIEAGSYDNQWRYYYRVVRPDCIPPMIRLKDGDELVFRQGTGGPDIRPPDPKICNLHLAIARVSYASGAAEIFDKFVSDEDEDGMQVPVYFGSPFVSDEVLMRRLEVLAYAS